MSLSSGRRDWLEENRNASDIVEQIKFFDEISFTPFLLPPASPPPLVGSTVEEMRKYLCVAELTDGKLLLVSNWCSACG